MNTAPPTLLPWQALSNLDEAGFVAHLGAVVEHSPWVAQQAWSAQPFVHWDALFDAFARAIDEASAPRQLALLRTHPELAGQEARAGSMTVDSQSEQGRLGLLSLDAHSVRRIESFNQRYRERFGFPFVVALRLHNSLESVLQAGERRLENDAPTERRIALQQVCEVMRGRLAKAVAPSPLPSLNPSTPTESPS